MFSLVVYFLLNNNGRKVANSYYLWCMQQSLYTSAGQLGEDEAVCIFIPKRVMLQIWIAKIWQNWASDHLEKLIMCNLFQLIWKPSISPKAPPRVNSDWIDILQILLIRFTRAQGIMIISPQLWCLMGITKPLIFQENSLFGLTFQIPNDFVSFQFLL